jgi:hypothetical protein
LQVALARLTDAARIAALPKHNLGEIMPDAIRTRCKFRVVGVEDTDYKVGTERVYEDGSTAAANILGVDHVSEFEKLDPATEGVEHDPYQRLGGTKRKYRIRWSGKYAQNIRLAAQYDPSIPEDQSFCEATPSGEVKLYISNPSVCGTFVPGKNYYLDLIPCE